MSAMLEQRPEAGQSGVVVLRGLVDAESAGLRARPRVFSTRHTPSETGMLRVVSREAAEMLK